MKYTLTIYLYQNDSNALPAIVELFSSGRIVTLEGGKYIIIADNDIVDVGHPLIVANAGSEYNVWCSNCGWVTVEMLLQNSTLQSLYRYHCPYCNNLLLELYSSK